MGRKKTLVLGIIVITLTFLELSSIVTTYAAPVKNLDNSNVYYDDITVNGTVDIVELNGQLWDDFSGDTLDTTKWKPATIGDSQVSIDNGRLHLYSHGDNVRAVVHPINYRGLTHLSAKLTIPSENIDLTDSTKTQWVGRTWITFWNIYNSDMMPPAPDDANFGIGDISARFGVLINNENTIEYANVTFGRCLDKACDDEENFGQYNFFTPVQYDTEYNLSVDILPDRMNLRLNDELYTYHIDGTKYPPHNCTYFNIRNRIKANAGEQCTLESYWDDVMIWDGNDLTGGSGYAGLYEGTITGNTFTGTRAQSDYNTSEAANAPLQSQNVFKWYVDYNGYLYRHMVSGDPRDKNFIYLATLNSNGEFNGTIPNTGITINGSIDGSGNISGTIGGSTVYDFNDDRGPDALYRHPGNGNVGIWLMDGATEDTWVLLGSHGTGWDARGVGDFNGDGSSDIIFRNNNGMIGIWLMDGTIEHTWVPVENHGTNWDVKGVGDFDNDGAVDVVYRNNSGTIGVWLMDGTTEDTWRRIGNHGTDWDVKGVGDFNGDGFADVLYSKVNGMVGVWLMDGTTEVTWQPMGNHGTYWQPECVADYNHDGNVDIVYQHTTGNVGVWLMTGTTESTWQYIGNHGVWEIR